MADNKAVMADNKVAMVDNRAMEVSRAAMDNRVATEVSRVATAKVDITRATASKDLQPKRVEETRGSMVLLAWRAWLEVPC